MAHFNIATLEVLDLNESMTMLAIKKELRSSNFTFFLDKKFLKSYSELLARAKKYGLEEV